MMMGPGATIFLVGRAGGGGRSPSPLTRLRINLRSRKSAEISAFVARWRCCLYVLLWFCYVFSNALMWFYYVPILFSGNHGVGPWASDMP
jgi:hypothetical protein